jgi:hypothetical protein
MKNLLTLLLLLTGMAVSTSCSDDKEDTTPTPAPLTLSGTLTGAQEVPAVTSSGTGAVTGTYDKTTKVLTYSVAYAGITPTVGHFHIGGPGVKGDVTVPFGFNNSTKDGYVSPITGAATLSMDQETALLANKFYANLHTAANPGGEIRADVTVK